MAQQVAEEAERQLYDESNIRRELLQLELDHEAGVIEDEDYVQRSDELLERLAQSRRRDNPDEAAMLNSEDQGG